jgi:H+/Cl- antiporter ClcA
MEQVKEPAGPHEFNEMLQDSGYRRLLVLATLLGVPVSLAAFGFLTATRAAQNGLWEHLPHQLGYSAAPWWWPLPLLTLAGLAVAWIVTRLPGNGGHVPARGLGGGATLGPSAVPGIVLAGLVSLAFGAVLGPEGPLTAMGAGLALLAIRSAHRADSPQLVAVLAATGSTAAIAVVLGSPIVAAVLIIEAAGVGGPRLFALVLPCLLAAGVGAVVFTGFGHWTGLATGALHLPTLPPGDTLGVGDFLWGLPLAAAIGCAVAVTMTFAVRASEWVGRRTARRTVLCAVLVGALLAAYGPCTGRTPTEAALSGQDTLAALAADPHSWPVSVLVWLLVLKGLAWSVSLAALRGGPVFPSLLLGPVLTMICAGLPGFGVTSALAVGLAASGTAVLRLPLTGAILATMLLGQDAPDQMPLIIVTAVVSFATGEITRSALRSGRWSSRRPPTGTTPAAAP